LRRTTVPQSTVNALAVAEDILDIGLVIRVAARSLVRADGVTFVLADGDHCFYEDEDAIAPLWKGQRFPQSTCISGWAMLHAEQAVIPDIRLDPRIPWEAYQPTFVKSLVMTPVGTPPMAAIGVYWARIREANPDEVAALRHLADLTAAAIDRVGLSSAPWAPNFELDDRMA